MAIRFHLNKYSYLAFVNETACFWSKSSNLISLIAMDFVNIKIECCNFVSYCKNALDLI